MKILGTLFRLLCALVVLLAVAIYLDGPLQVSLVDYIGAFTPEHIQSLADVESWLAIAAGALLLLALCCGMKLGWNLVYCLATLAFFAEVALLTLGADTVLPSALRGLGWEGMLRELALSYPVPTLMIPTLCILGCLCSSAPVRIAWTSLISCALAYGCAELLFWGVQHWQAMPEPFLPDTLAIVLATPWLIAALPTIFFAQYSLFMTLFETFSPRGCKVKTQKSEKQEEKPAAQKPEKSKSAAPAAAKLPATPVVVVKRPVVHKKSPVSPTSEEVKKEAATKSEKAEEQKPEEPKEAAPAEEKKEEQKPEGPKETAPAEEKKEEQKPEDAPKASEKTEETKPVSAEK